jgi:hypothetical protein
MSLRQTAAWAAAVGVGEMSDVAILKRLRKSGDWLGHIMSQWLRERGLSANVPEYRVCLIDASVISKPGSTGIDHRVHLRYDLGAQRIAGVEVTDYREGESLKRHEVQPGEVVVADRGYASRQGISWVLSQGGHVVVRAHWHNTGIQTVGGKRLGVVPLLQTLGDAEVGDWRVSVEDAGRRHVLRLVAVKKSTAAADREKNVILGEARHKVRNHNPLSLKAAEYFYVLTDLPEAVPAIQVLELYRLRWQIELAFKKLKSLLHLDNLRAKDPELARTYLLAKLLGALIVEELSGAALSFFPWGYRLPAETTQPLAVLRSVG